MSSKRLAARLWPALTATVGLALVNAVAAGCATENVIGGHGPEPGVAAAVNDESLTLDEVDSIVDEYCTVYEDYPQAQPFAKSDLRTNLVFSWVNSVAVEQLADEAGIATPEPTDQDVETFGAQLGGIDADNRDTFAAILRLQNLLSTSPPQVGVVVELGRASLQEEGTPAPSDTQAARRGQKLVADWLAEQDVVVNPAFGSIEDGVPAPDSDELSIPVSKLATDAAADQQSPEYLADLPPAQRCGPATAPVPVG